MRHVIIALTIAGALSMGMGCATMKSLGQIPLDKGTSVYEETVTVGSVTLGGLVTFAREVGVALLDYGLSLVGAPPE